MPSTERVNPLADVTPLWDGEWDVYPPVIRVAMEDGTVRDYQLESNQQPAFRRVISLLDKLPIYGGYKAPAIKKRRRL